MNTEETNKKLFSSYTREEVLHTKSAFLNGKVFSLDIHSTTMDIDTAIIMAENKEKMFYQRFGKNSYDDFINMVRMGFHYNEQDRLVLQRFSYNSLIKSIPELAQSQNHQMHDEEEYELTVNFKLTPPKQVKNILLPDHKGKDPLGDKLNEALQSLTLDDGRLVKLLNLAQNQIKVTKQGTTTNMKSGRKRSDAIAKGKYSTKGIEVIEKLEQLMTNDESWLVIGIKKGGQEVPLSTILKEDKTEKNFPWGYKPKEIAELIKDPDKKQRLNHAFLVVKDFVLRKLGSGASPELKRALEITWNQKIGPSLNSDFSFFERGSIYSEALKGAFGEFQSAAIFELFNIRYGGSTAKTIARITGDTDSQAGLADVVAFEQFGVQVKNFNEARKNNIIDTTTNPKLLTQYFQDESVAKDVRIFLANYFFNKSFAKTEGVPETYKKLETDISTLYYALFSLSVSNDTRVSFYTISGRYFVPASEILRAIKYNSAIAKPMSISSKTTIGRNDDGFNDNNLYKTYWQPYTVENNKTHYEPTPQNTTSYQNLVGNAITIKSGFDYQTILGDLTNSRYSLWK